MLNARDLADELCAVQLPSDSQCRLCDCCVVNGKRYLLCACNRTVSIFVGCSVMEEQGKEDGPFHLYQIIEVPYLTSAITSVCWCKSEVTGISENGGFALASATEIAVYCPLALDTESLTKASLEVFYGHGFKDSGHVVPYFLSEKGETL